MVKHSIDYMAAIASSNPAGLTFATERLKEEHEDLRAALKILETNAKEIILLEDSARGLQALQELRKQTQQFMEKLEQHSDWEEQELFPFLQQYFHRQPAPSIMPSFWVLEKDHQLGISFIESFNEAVIEVSPIVVKKQIAEAASNLLQACLILNDHFTMEEQLIYPLTEKVLTDLDYFFS